MGVLVLSEAGFEKPEFLVAWDSTYDFSFSLTQKGGGYVDRISY